MLRTKQYGTAIFSQRDGQWKIELMTVFDPEIWEPESNYSRSVSPIGPEIGFGHYSV